MNKDFNIKKILKFAIPCAIVFICFCAFVIFSLIASVRTSIANAPLEDIINYYDRGNYTKVLTATMDELENERYKTYYDLAYEKALEGIEKNIVLENYKSAFDDSTKLRDILYADSTVTDIYNNSKSLYADSLLNDIKLSVAKGDIDSALSSIDDVLSLDPLNEIALDHLTNITALNEEERIATEEAEALRLAEEERIALEQAESERLAEEERLEAERLAEEQRIAEEKAKAAMANNATINISMYEYVGSGYNSYNINPSEGIAFNHFFHTGGNTYMIDKHSCNAVDFKIYNTGDSDITISKVDVTGSNLNFETGSYFMFSPFQVTAINEVRKSVNERISPTQNLLVQFNFSEVTAYTTSGTLTLKFTFSDGSIQSVSIPYSLT